MQHLTNLPINCHHSLSTINNGLSTAYPQPEAYHVSLAHLQPIKPGFWDRKDTLLIPACRLTMLSM
ncbi:hypothetical protein HPP92_009657 [Vanilla planifolia]|uniref:Uncharacterized protein n=1 Tax=Vanilla planifolia TaxID=51239 RepID=A0A835R8A6_VANPL|nr:hypothetical protein HPP92_009657 [Vanilla planifolia]